MFPADVQAALDQAAKSKAAADQSAAKAITDDATAKASDTQANTDDAKLKTDAATAIAALTGFLVVSPTPALPASPSAP